MSFIIRTFLRFSTEDDQLAVIRSQNLRIKNRNWQINNRYRRQFQSNVPKWSWNNVDLLVESKTLSFKFLVYFWSIWSHKSDHWIVDKRCMLSEFRIQLNDRRLDRAFILSLLRFYIIMMIWTSVKANELIIVWRDRKLRWFWYHIFWQQFDSKCRCKDAISI